METLAPCQPNVPSVILKKGNYTTRVVSLNNETTLVYLRTFSRSLTKVVSPIHESTSIPNVSLSITSFCIVSIKTRYTRFTLQFKYRDRRFSFYIYTIQKFSFFINSYRPYMLFNLVAFYEFPFKIKHLYVA